MQSFAAKFPTAHKLTHAIGGGDPLLPADIGAASTAAVAASVTSLTNSLTTAMANVLRPPALAALALRDGGGPLHGESLAVTSLSTGTVTAYPIYDAASQLADNAQLSGTPYIAITGSLSGQGQQTVTFSGQPATGALVTLNSSSHHFASYGVVAGTDFVIGSTLTATVANLAAAINAHGGGAIGATASGTTLFVTGEFVDNVDVDWGSYPTATPDYEGPDTLVGSFPSLAAGINAAGITVTDSTTIPYPIIAVLSPDENSIALAPSIATPGAAFKIDYTGGSNVTVENYALTWSNISGAPTTPVIISVKNVTVLTSGTPADIATVTLPAGVTRYRLYGTNLSSAVSTVVTETASGTLASATFAAYDAAGGGGNQVLNGTAGGATALSTVTWIATGTTLKTASTLYIRQTSNSSNAGICSFYIAVLPLH